MIGKTILHYKILDKLGEGGMGVVYKAQDIKLQRPVALKFLPPHIADNPEEKARFIQEAQSASALGHPNISTIYGIEESSEGMFISMEYIEGKTLKEIAEKEILPIKNVLDMAIQIAEGLAMAHEKNIVHRDIKSANLMLTPRGQVKIMDFGLAKLKGAVEITEAGSTLGTAAYMSPEQAQGEEVDQRSDIFSLGVVLYELLTSRLPFGGEHTAAIIYSILHEEPQPIARFNNQVSPKLEEIVFKTLSKDKVERYQHIDDLLADLRREKKSLEYTKSGKITTAVVAPKPKGKLLPFIIPTSIVFVLALLLLILKPFKFEIVPEEKAVAKENTLAIMYFENLVDREDKERLGEVVTNLLITDLSESQYMNVVSSQRLYDILKLMGQEGSRVIDKEVASKVAIRAGAKWMLLGSILQLQPEVILTSQLVEVKSGKVLTSQRISGKPDEQIFSLVDKLTVEIKSDLSLPLAAKQEKDPPVADVTTRSPEAYRYYLEGVDNLYKVYHLEARENFKKAVEYDSTFAMAYYRLTNFATSEEERKKLITKALKYSDKVSQKEKLYIKAMQAGVEGDVAQLLKETENIVKHYPDEKEAVFTLGAVYYQRQRNLEQAVRYLNRAIEIDPLYKVAYNMLAYAYNEMGDFEKSIWAINKYISLAPDEANPYDTRGDLYAYNGKKDQAIESYRKSLEKKPDFYASLIKLGHMYLFKREYPRAESCYKALSVSDDKDYRAGGRTLLSLVPQYQGKFEEALRILDDGLTADRMEQVEGEPNISKHSLKALIYYEKRNFDLALKEIGNIQQILNRISPDNPVKMRDWYAILLAENGKIKEAEEVLHAMKKDIEQKNKALMDNYWRALGVVELIKRNSKIAASCLEKGLKEAKSPNFEARYFLAQAYLAQAYLESGRLGEAVAELEKALSRYDENRVSFVIWSVKTHYLLGLAYEKSGWDSKAIAQYEEFLDIWKDSDPGIKEIEDAKARLKRLKGKV